jgi:hypothetical protein
LFFKFLVEQTIPLVCIFANDFDWDYKKAGIEMAIREKSDSGFAHKKQLFFNPARQPQGTKKVQ